MRRQWKWEAQESSSLGSFPERREKLGTGTCFVFLKGRG